MPQATDELRDTMRKWFGDGCDPGPPLTFLFSRGYKDRAGVIMPPTASHTVSVEEATCIDFLFQEWDFAYGVHVPVVDGAGAP